MVRSLSLPGSYHQKITHLGRSLLSFSNLKHLDLSRNALESLEVCTYISHSYYHIWSHMVRVVYVHTILIWS